MAVRTKPLLPGFLYGSVGQRPYIVPAPPVNFHHQEASSVLVPDHGRETDRGAQVAGVHVLTGVLQHHVTGGSGTGGGCSSVWHH